MKFSIVTGSHSQEHQKPIGSLLDFPDFYKSPEEINFEKCDLSITVAWQIGILAYEIANDGQFPWSNIFFKRVG